MAVTFLLGDCREALSGLPPHCVQTVVTSPPYFGLRDYGVEGQIGLEKTPDAYVAELVDVFRNVWDVLRPNGTVFLNLGDCYARGGSEGLKPKDLLTIPARAATRRVVPSKSDCLDEKQPDSGARTRSPHVFVGIHILTHEIRKVLLGL